MTVVAADNKRRLCTLILAGALPWTLGADSAAIDPVKLATTESVFGACADISTSLAEKLRVKLKELTQDASESQLAEVRHSDAYRSAYGAVQGLFAQNDGHDIKRRCTEMSAAGQ